MTTLPIWPLPLQASAGEQILWLKSDVAFELINQTSTEQSWIRDLREDFYSLVFDIPLVPEKLRGLNEDFEPSVAATRTHIDQVRIVVTECHDASSVQAREEYTIDLDHGESGVIIKCTISAFEGGLYAIQTLRQLFYKHSQVSDPVHGQAALCPSWLESGHLAEQNRPKGHHAYNRWHVRNEVEPIAPPRDRQSWPLDIPALPELAKKGAYSRSRIWTAADLKEVQSYARRRAVDMFVEIDVPGHTGSIHHSFPDLIVAYNQQPWEEWAAQPPAGQLKLNDPAVDQFLKTLLNDILPRTAPFSDFYHVGGDEIITHVYELDPGVASSDADALRHRLQALFDIIMERVQAAGLTPIAWEEVLLDWNLRLPPSTIIQVWRSHERLSEVVERGYRALFGASSHWYLDGGQGSWADPDPRKGEKTAAKPPFLDWCDPFKNTRQVCSYDPFEGVPTHLHHLLHGGETHLWSELTDSVTPDGKLWPRAAAAAERLWAGHHMPPIDEHMTRRLAELRERLVIQGIGASVVQVEWSLRNIGSSLQ